ANGVRSVSLVDIDDDGDLDILAALSNDSQIVWYENTNGLGLFSTANVITSLLNFPTTVVASDIDGDNDLD
ncbi:MAG TPA: hypothetical protein DCS66_12055, partial [Flavobacteriaceae bacterium]|nr:hypothetical protein [Flavobacteriaceae bacterium]